MTQEEFQKEKSKIMDTNLNEENSEINVLLTDSGIDKIRTIGIIRVATGLSLNEAKYIVDNPPKVIKENISKNEAESLINELEKVGAKGKLSYSERKSIIDKNQKTINQNEQNKMKNEKGKKSTTKKFKEKTRLEKFFYIMVFLLIIGSIIAFTLAFAEISNKNSSNENKVSNDKVSENNIDVIEKTKLSQDQKNKLVLSALQDRLNEKVNKGDLLHLGIKEQDDYDRYLVYSIVTSSQATTNPDNNLKIALSNTEYNYMYYLTKSIPKNRIYVGVISLNSKNGLYEVSVENTSNLINYDYEKFIDAQNGSDSTSEKMYMNSAEQKALKALETAKNTVKWNQPRDTSNGNTNNTTKTNTIVNNVNTSSYTDSNDTKTSQNIKNGTYNKKLTSDEKDDESIQLGDINFVIKDNKITLSDNSAQLVIEGTYTVKDNKLVGTYTKATYYSYDKLDFVTDTIEDKFEFEINNNNLYDTMGFGQFSGKCLYRNATYEFVE